MPDTLQPPLAPLGSLLSVVPASALVAVEPLEPPIGVRVVGSVPVLPEDELDDEEPPEDDVEDEDDDEDEPPDDEDEDDVEPPEDDEDDEPPDDEDVEPPDEDVEDDEDAVGVTQRPKRSNEESHTRPAGQPLPVERSAWQPLRQLPVRRSHTRPESVEPHWPSLTQPNGAAASAPDVGSVGSVGSVGGEMMIGGVSSSWMMPPR